MSNKAKDGYHSLPFFRHGRDRPSIIFYALKIDLLLRDLSFGVD